MGISTDIYGAPRIQGARVNVGAVETVLAGMPGTTYVVTSLADSTAADGVITLREALAAANSNQAVGDAPAGSYSATDVIAFAAGLSGSIYTNGQAYQVSGSVNITGPGISELTIDGGGVNGVLDIRGSYDVSVSGMTITGGNTRFGGGIYTAGSRVTLNQTVVTGNTASHGGGMYLDSCTSTLANVTISGNTASYGGGVEQSCGTSTLTSVIVSGNTALSGYGGGVFQWNGTSALTNVTISGNTVFGNGGGACLHYGTSTLTNVTISGNTASGDGGGVEQFGNISTLTDVVISGNTASSGGGVYQWFGTLALTNVTIGGNTASGNGGGTYLTSGTSTFTLRNTIVAQNGAGAGPDVYVTGTGAVLSGSNNLIGDGAGQTFLVSGSSGNLVGTSISPVDPQFVNMAGTDWTKWDLHLQATSPAVNAGNNAWIPTGVTTDITGGARIIGGTVDMGAYEYNSGNSAPNDIALSNNIIAENQPSGTAVGTFSTSDPDAGDTFTYSLVSGTGSTDNGSFTISGNRLLTAASFDYETKSSYSIRVRTTDAGGLWVEKAFTITVTPVVVNIPDANLEAAIRTALNKPTGSITVGDMQSLTHLDARSSGIKDLTGLEYATQLGDLDLFGNQISDISRLSGLTWLQWLMLSANKITDVTALSGMPWLEGLDLTGNQISDISALSGLTQLQHLWLDGNQISDISAISGMTQLIYLGLAGNQISDLSALSGLTQVQHLWLDGNQIGDIAALSGLTQLQDVSLDFNQISDLSALSGLTQLVALCISDNQISDLSALSGLTQLQGLDLVDNRISDISALSGMTGLYCLNLSSNQIGDISPLSGLTQLMDLYLSSNQIDDISALSGMTAAKGLRCVDVSSNRLDVSTGSLAMNLIQGWIDSGVTVTYLPQSPVNRAPTDITLSGASVVENQPVGTVVGTLSSTDLDSGDTFAYTLVAGSGSDDNGSFTIVGNQVQTAASFDFEARSSYSIRVRTTDAGGLFVEKVFTVTVSDVNEQPSIANQSFAIAENSGNGTAVGTVVASDPDAGQSLTYSITAGNTGNALTIDPSTGQITVASSSAFDYEITLCFSLTVQVTDNGIPVQSKSATVTVNLNDINEAPTDISLSPASIAENQPAGAAVGTLGSSDPDTGNTFAYSLVSGMGSSDNASFAISGSELQTTATFDYDTKNSYSIRVRTTDQGGLWFEKAFAVTVTNVNEAPRDVALAGTTVAENQAAGTVAGMISSTDPDGGSTFSYSLVSGAGSTDNGSFTISGSELLTAGPFDYEGQSSYSIRVRSTDQGGLWFEKAFTITVTDVNEAPTDISLSSSSIAENQPAGSAIGTLSATDADAGSTFAYSLVSGTGSMDNASFRISGNTLQTAASFDYENKSNYSILVRAADQGGLWLEKVFTIGVTNVNEVPTDIALSNSSIAEAQPSGAVVGTFGSTDPDVGDAFAYSLVAGAGGADNSSFTISGNQFKTAGVLDYEARSSYSIRVRSTDFGGLYTEKVFAITVSDVNEAPTDIALSNSSVAENQLAGTAVGTLSSSDQDAGDRFSYSLASGSGSADNGSFSISGSQLVTAGPLNYEGKNSYSVRVRSTDSGGLWFEEVVTVAVTNVNETPTDVSLSSTAVQENQAAGAVVGAFISSDPDLGDTFVYALVTGSGSADNANFTISAGQLLTTSSFNYEGKSSYSIRVRSSDAGGLYVEKAFAISVSNVNETPTDVALSNASVAENQAAGTVVGILSSVDPDLGDTSTYSLVSGAGSTDNASFAITGNQFKTAAGFDYEGKNSYSVRIRSSDAGGLYVEKAFTISVTNVNERPADVVLSNASVAENQGTGTVVGTLASFDPDGNETFTYSLVGGTGGDDNGSFMISGSELLTAGSFDHEAKDSYSIRIRSTDAGGLHFEKVFVIGVSDVNEAPTDVALSSTTVQENQAAGTVVGTLSSSDPDRGETLTYALVDGTGGEDNHAFAINGGQLMTSKRFNYEAKKSYLVRVRATDSGGLSFEKGFAIGISDAEDLRGTFGLVDGRKVTLPPLMDADGDLVTFKLSGTGMAKVYGFDKSFEDIILSGTGPKTALTIKVKKVGSGDGVVTLGNISSDGPLKSINAPAAMLSGLVQVNALNQFAGKATVAMKLRQISDADIQVQGMPVSSIVVSGDVSDSRIVTTGSIKKFSAATLLDSDILVGVATNCGEHFAAADDFVSVTAKLGSLKVSGRKLPSGSQHPAYVAGSHISAPSVGTVTLLNVADGSGPVVHVLNDAGTLKVSQSKLTSAAMFASGTWKVAGVRPMIWEVV